MWPCGLCYKIGAGDDAVDDSIAAGQLAHQHAVDFGIDGEGVVAVDVPDRTGPAAGSGGRRVERYDVVAYGLASDGGQVYLLGGAVGLVGDYVISDGCAVLVEGHYLVCHDVAIGCGDALRRRGEQQHKVGRGHLLRLGVEFVLEVLESQQRCVVLGCRGVKGYLAYQVLPFAGVALDLCEVRQQEAVPQLRELRRQLEAHAHMHLLDALRISFRRRHLRDYLVAVADAVGETSDFATPLACDWVECCLSHSVLFFGK